MKRINTPRRIPRLVVPLNLRDQLKRPVEYWKSLGPGLTTGASDDDPSGIATYSQTGALYGYQYLWLAPFTFPLMSLVQEMCARIGLVTGRGLAGNIRQHYPRWVLYSCACLLFMANTFNIGANLGAMAKAAQLIFPNASFTLLVVLFALGSLYFQIYSTYQKYAKYLKYLALVLIAYVFSALSVPSIDWLEVGRATITPSFTFTKDHVILLSALLGTTISPYLFFWQTSQEVEEEILAGKTSIAARVATTTKEDVSLMRKDVWSGMFLSNAVMFFIIVACAATIFRTGGGSIETAADAAAALRPFAGDGATIVFALGIIGTGLLAIPVLAGSSSYAIAESFGWKAGLYRSLNKARAFYGVIALSTLIGLAINFIGIDPIDALIYAAMANAVVSPIILVMIVRMSSNKSVMGEWVNSSFSRAMGWLVVVLMAAAALGAFWVLI